MVKVTDQHNPVLHSNAKQGNETNTAMADRLLVAHPTCNSRHANTTIPITHFQFLNLIADLFFFDGLQHFISTYSSSNIDSRVYVRYEYLAITILSGVSSFSDNLDYRINFFISADNLQFCLRAKARTYCLVEITMRFLFRLAAKPTAFDNRDAVDMSFPQSIRDLLAHELLNIGIYHLHLMSPAASCLFSVPFVLDSATQYSTGKTINVSNVDEIRPPNTTVAKGR